FLENRDPRASIVVLASADLGIADDVVELLVQRFADDPAVGMAGVRPVPANGHGTWLGAVVAAQWEMHHRVCLTQPKMGELVAFRADLVERVSELSVV